VALGDPVEGVGEVGLRVNVVQFRSLHSAPSGE
jgi:hypothetical protein